MSSNSFIINSLHPKTCNASRKGGTGCDGFQPDTYYFLVSDERKLSEHFEKRPLCMKPFFDVAKAKNLTKITIFAPYCGFSIIFA
jgi:hypothetical protein